MKKMLTHTLISFLILSLFMTSCKESLTPAAVNIPPEAAPADTPSDCGGFGELQFGEYAATLLEGGYFELVRYGCTFGGYNCNAHYNFDDGGRLSGGHYSFNDSLTLGWNQSFELYLNLRNKLISVYGEPSPAGEDTPDIGELAAAGEGGATEIWNSVASDTAPHGTAAIVLQLQPNGFVTVSFRAM